MADDNKRPPKGFSSEEVRKIENWLIFYLPLKNGVDVLRILHGARDLHALLE